MPQRRVLKDSISERHLYRRRSNFAMWFCMFALAALALRYFMLQVVDYEIYKVQSDRNRIQLQPIPPKRGLIFDRNGRLLADNVATSNLMIVRERVGSGKGALDATINEIRQLIDVDDDDVKNFRRLLRSARPYQEVPLRFRLSDQEMAIIAANRYRLPGVEVHGQLVRHYPYGPLMAHVLGYVGRINEAEAGAIDAVNYSGTHHIGKTGIEQQYEKVLHGTVGYQNVETNARGRVLRVLEQHDPVPGQNITLNVDVNLQAVAQSALGEERGAIVAMDVRTGGVLAMVSAPSYDANLFVTGISRKDYARLRESKDLPLFNRALQGQYPPGSTLKPIFGLAGLHYGVVTEETTWPDPGWYKLPNDDRLYRDWKRWGHGSRIGLHQAIAQSCDTYFYNLAYQLGIDRISAFSQGFGLGEPTGIDIGHERPGLLPSRLWKRAEYGVHWYPGETLNVGIGQGYMLTTPLQLALATTVIANRGASHVPTLLRALGDYEVAAREREFVDAEDVHWDAIHQAMKAVVHGVHGTANGISPGLNYRIAGKTGTAQVVGIAAGEEYDSEALEKRQRDHALFVAFAPADNPQIAVAVIVENGEAGGGVAAPVARKVLEAWLNPVQVAVNE